MSVIATAIEPTGIVRIFFDLRRSGADRHDEAQIAEAIVHAAELDGAAAGTNRKMPD